MSAVPGVCFEAEVVVAPLVCRQSQEVPELRGIALCANRGGDGTAAAWPAQIVADGRTGTEHAGLYLAGGQSG